MQHFDADATRSALDFARLIPALRAAFAGEATVPPRHVHAVEAGSDRGTVLIMPAWSEAGFLGIKTINIFPGNGARGLPGLHATYVLYDAHTGVPLAMMDGNEITAHRTAAASALGASFLARRDARRLLVLGTGRVAGCCRPRTPARVRSTRCGSGTTAPKVRRPWRRNGAAKAGMRVPRPTWRPPCAAPTS